MFRSWPQALPDAVEVCPILLPGRGSRFGERPFDRLADLVSEAAAALGPYLDRPFVFFGHSMGALVAFELARELRRQGLRSPTLLLMAGHEAPHRPAPLPPMGHLPDAEFIEEMRRRYEGIPDEVLAEPELLELVLPMLRADLATLESYVYSAEAPLECPVSCFGGTEDRHLTSADLDAWRELTRGAFRVRFLPGNHFFLETARGELLRAIAEDLALGLNGSLVP